MDIYWLAAVLVWVSYSWPIFAYYQRTKMNWKVVLLAMGMGPLLFVWFIVAALRGQPPKNAK